MKKQFICFIFLLTSILTVGAQNTFTADFETFDSTPYYFRFGNNSSATHFPRWKYAHNLVDNPFIDNINSSTKVLRYSSLEARWYGLKFKFPAPLNLEDIDTLSFDIYQPANIIGKAVNSTYSTAMATTQEIRVKLLTYFNTTQDSREDAGVVLTFTGAVQSFTTTGQWIKYQAIISPSKFAAVEQTKLAAGVLGMAIMPTYNTGVTLQTEYNCYIDNIKTRKTVATTTETVLEKVKLKVIYSNNQIIVKSELEGEGTIRVYDTKGNVVTELWNGNIQSGEQRFSPNLSTGLYFVSIHINGKFHNFKIIS